MKCSRSSKINLNYKAKLHLNATKHLENVKMQRQHDHSSHKSLVGNSLPTDLAPQTVFSCTVPGVVLHSISWDAAGRISPPKHESSTNTTRMITPLFPQHGFLCQFPNVRVIKLLIIKGLLLKEHFNFGLLVISCNGD